ncbi:MAG TPA: preprotein translocase subunit YajC [Actinotalea caeni]|uniref:preprotein translocase subunit YajC n=1 Tax=Actinotalea caeni TaxID=1348467 RepID=UPI002B4B0029|nr:preprotein translocase subunit YajC [Actinotalea caeni]HLV56805.1 preprotein translocase subunit YajC [Actinotalea caeni]
MDMAAAASSGGGSSSFLLIFMVLAVVALFVMNSFARKRQAKATEFRSTLQPGQQVMTAAGMFGTVTAVDGDKVTLVSSGGQESEWLLAAIAKLVEDQTSAEEAEDDAVEPAAADDPTSRYIADAADVPPTDLGPDGRRDETTR